MDCDSPVHLRWQLITAIGLLLWSFGIPFLLQLGVVSRPMHVPMLLEQLKAEGLAGAR